MTWSFQQFGWRMEVQRVLVAIGLQECTLDLDDLGSNFQEVKQQLYANGMGWA